MKNELTVFNNPEFGQLRMVFIDGKQYFMASDVAKALGYTNPNKAVNDHCKAITKCYTPISGKEQEINFIPEGDVYRLIIRSFQTAQSRGIWTLGIWWGTINMNEKN